MGNELIDPDAGEVVRQMQIDMSRIDSMPVDELVQLYEEQRVVEDAAHNARIQLAAAIARRAPMTQDGCRTTRLRGDRVRIRVEWPDYHWDQSVLREIWTTWPDLATQYLAIDRLRTRAIETKKLVNESGDEDFQEFRSLLLGAKQEPRGTPRIIVEEKGEGR